MKRELNRWRPVAIFSMFVFSAAAIGSDQTKPQDSDSRIAASPSTTSSVNKDVRVQQVPASVTPTSTLGVPARFGEMSMRLDVRQCMRAAEHAVTNELQLREVQKGNDWIGGNNGQAHGYVYCVRRPKSGACGGDASAAVIIASGGKGKAVEALYQAIHDAIPNITPFDC
jgi:hypothetical protein